MKRLLPLFFWLLFVLSPSSAQDAEPSLYTQALKTLADSEESLNHLEQNISDSSMIMTDLSAKVSSMQTIISQQQAQLKMDSDSFSQQERIWKERSSDYEQTIESLSASYNSLQVQNHRLETDNANLQKRNMKLTMVIIVMGVIIGISIAGVIVLIIFKKKT